jgi:hypothetical protein
MKPSPRRTMSTACPVPQPLPSSAPRRFEPPGWRLPLPEPRLRSLLVSAAERARHPHAEARELAPGLHELVAHDSPHDPPIPDRGELRFHGIGPGAAFSRARRGTCSEALEFGRAGPLPGVHAYIVGGPGGRDTAVAALELEWLGAPLGPAGAVLAFPARGTALLLAPLASGLRPALARLGRFRQFWCSDADDAPLRLHESLRFLATWTANAHARLPGPVSPALYWQRPGGALTLLVADARGPFDPPAQLLGAAA